MSDVETLTRENLHLANRLAQAEAERDAARADMETMTDIATHAQDERDAARAEAATERGHRNHAIEVINRIAAERDAARAEVEGWKNQAHDIAVSNASHIEWHREAETRVAKLEAALREIAGEHKGSLRNAAKIARAALAPEPQQGTAPPNAVAPAHGPPTFHGVKLCAICGWPRVAHWVERLGLEVMHDYEAPK